MNMTGSNARPEGALRAEMATWARQLLESRGYRTSLRRRLLSGRAGRLEEIMWRLAFEQSVADERKVHDDADQLCSHMTDEELEALVKIHEDVRKINENARARMNAAGRENPGR